MALKKHSTLIFHWGKAVYPLWWPIVTKDLQTEPKKDALRWCGAECPGPYERAIHKKEPKSFNQPIQYVFKDQHLVQKSIQYMLN